MSDRRRQIAERHMNGAGAKCKCPLCEKTIEAAMSDYAAAVLEDEATNVECRVLEFREADDVAALIEVATRLRARAAQERAR